MRDPHALLNLILALHGDVRDEIVAATERHSLDRMASIDRDDEGDTIYAIDVVGEAIVTRLAEALAHACDRLLPSTGRLREGLAASSSTQSMARVASCTRSAVRGYSRPSPPIGVRGHHCVTSSWPCRLKSLSSNSTCRINCGQYAVAVHMHSVTTG